MCVFTDSGASVQQRLIGVLGSQRARGFRPTSKTPRSSSSSPENASSSGPLSPPPPSLPSPHSRSLPTPSRVATDLTAYDQTQYAITLRPSTYTPSVPRASSSSGPAQYHLGEALTVEWTAPANHSRKDWIGIYRMGANKSRLVTRVSSQGKWVGVFGEEWEGEGGKGEGKEVRFEGKRLPWRTGVYELR